MLIIITIIIAIATAIAYKNGKENGICSKEPFLIPISLLFWLAPQLNSFPEKLETFWECTWTVQADSTYANKWR